MAGEFMNTPLGKSLPASSARFAFPALILLAAAFAGCVVSGDAKQPAQWIFLYLWTVGPALATALILACFALLLGYGALRILQPKDPIHPSLAVSWALGWGLLSHLTLILGAIGSVTGWNFYKPWMPSILILVAFLVLRPQALELVNWLRTRINRIKEKELTFAALVAMIFTAAVVARLILTALTPCVSYDVLEYHLPIINAALSSGTPAPIVGNAYSLMPQGGEMLFLMGRMLEGHASAFTPKCIHLALAFSTALILLVILREMEASISLRLMGVLIFLLHPISRLALSDAYIDMGPALYTTAAVLCWLRAWKKKNLFDAWLGAALTGFAASCKYPAIGISALPYILVLAPMLPGSAMPKKLSGRIGWLRVPATMAMFFCLMAAVYSPWLARAIVIDGSTMPPMTLSQWVDPDFETSAIRNFMIDVHRPGMPFGAEHWRNVIDRMPKLGYLWFASAVLLLVSPVSRWRRRGIAAFALFGYLVWTASPHAPDRFLTPVLPAFIACAVILAVDLRRALPRYGRWGVVPFMVWIGIQAPMQFAEAVNSGFVATGLGMMSQEDFEKRQLGKTADFFEAIRGVLDDAPQTHALLLYDARAGAFPQGQTVTNTVFDPSLLWMLLRQGPGDDPATVVQELRERGITTIAVNEVELARLLWTYPARKAWDDPAYLEARKRVGPKGFDPAMLAFRKYYPPYYYYSGANPDEVENRLDTFLEYCRKSLVWETNIGGARMWVARVENH
jgi:hypothetical protein